MSTRILSRNTHKTLQHNKKQKTRPNSTVCCFLAVAILLFGVHTVHVANRSWLNLVGEGLMTTAATSILKDHPLPTFEDLRTEFETTEERWKRAHVQEKEGNYHALTLAHKIAYTYDIPATPLDGNLRACAIGGEGNLTNATGTIRLGWIPCRDCGAHLSESGRIPRLIFQTWKSRNVSPAMCKIMTAWSDINPEYDYFLFDDKATETFISREFGPHMLAAYQCLQVGAAMSDVWRLLIVYLYGGIYFDADVELKRNYPFRTWGFALDPNRTVVTGNGCANKPRKFPRGCAHQWGLLFAPQHAVLRAAILETLHNLANRQAVHVYDVSFWAYYNSWHNSPYNQSYMPGWADYMGGRVVFSEPAAKDSMNAENGHWANKNTAEQIWHPHCLWREAEN